MFLSDSKHHQQQNKTTPTLKKTQTKTFLSYPSFSCWVVVRSCFATWPCLKSTKSLGVRKAAAEVTLNIISHMHLIPWSWLDFLRAKIQVWRGCQLQKVTSVMKSCPSSETTLLFLQEGKYQSHQRKRLQGKTRQMQGMGAVHQFGGLGTSVSKWEIFVSVPCQEGTQPWGALSGCTKLILLQQ